MAHAYGFRPLTGKDMPLLARWLGEPHVAAWWGDKKTELKGIGENIDSISVEPFIMELDGRPIGYIQSYDPHLEDENPYQDQPTGTLGIDQFIGEPEPVGKGHGTQLIAEFVEMLFEEGAPRVIIDPDPANAVAIHVYEKVGFQPIGRRQTEHGEVLLMAIDNDEGEDEE
ncbi:aminoglycoside 6'-N-acetyltransferase [Mesorhizobium soli]|uniref:GNAT family N-acetyltransferase n=1 Tax=Pseudaminobacter soli (ex Li et al. 2025) TaxID=1295366 RepID=UPI002473BF42|nr:GNAT family N-acetyltransferase [Mesorhizobium soli]MDH6231332.1 aminoglycoside 6'-N-acetyltransferase [Mesorhizobium soli]